ncbi:hypothetical protein LQZ18_06995 [Lachnospiraceae bacterium ZAX-1]
MNTYDSNLFPDNPDVKAYVEHGVISPKYIMQHFVAWLMQLGLPWANTRFVYSIMSIVIISFAFTNICYQLKVNHPIICVLFLLIGMLSNSTNAEIALFGFFDDIGVIGGSLQLSYDIPFLAISFCIGKEKKWNAGIIFSAIAMLIHPHESFYGLCIIAILWLIDGISNKRFNFCIWKGTIVWIIATIIAMAPNMITDFSDLTPIEYLENYITYRYSRHLITATFDKRLIVMQGLIFIFCGIVLWCHFNKSKYKKSIRLSLIFFPATFLFALLFMHLFTDIYWIEFVPKMFVAKYFKYVCFIYLIGLMIYLDQKLSNKNIYIATFLFISVCFVHGILIATFAIAVFELALLRKLIKKCNFENNKLPSTHFEINLRFCIFFGVLIIITAFLTYFYLGRDLNFVMANIYYLVLIAMAIPLQLLMNQKISINTPNKFIYGTVIFLLIFSLTSHLDITVANSSDTNDVSKAIHLRSANNMLETRYGDELYHLATKFNESTNPNDGFVVDTTLNWLEGPWVSMLSERDCYYTKNIVPSTMAGVSDWLNRFDKLNRLGLFNQKTPDELLSFLDDINYQYILIKGVLPALDNSNKFKLFLQEGDFVIYKKLT